MQKVDKPHYNDQLLNEYSLFLLKLDTSQIESSTISAKKFIELFEKQDKNTCDSAYLIFNNFYRKLNNNLDELHDKDTTIKYDSLLTNPNIAHRQLSNKLTLYAQKLKDNGFNVYMSEGDTYIGQDLDFVARWFYGYVSPAMKEYLVQLNKENKEGFSEDAGLTISPTQLAERTIWWEKFISKNPHCIVFDNAKSIWKSYLGTLLQGMDNSPVINDDQKTIDNYYKRAYGYIQNSYPDTQTNKLISPYFKLLVQKDNDKANQLLKKYQKERIIE